MDMTTVIFRLKKSGWGWDNIYEAIKTGAKTSEWRDAKDHWRKRLTPKPDKAWFTQGYPKGSLPRLEADVQAKKHNPSQRRNHNKQRKKSTIPIQMRTLQTGPPPNNHQNPGQKNIPSPTSRQPSRSQQTPPTRRRNPSGEVREDTRRPKRRSP